MLRRLLAGLAPVRRPAALLAVLSISAAAACRELAFEPQDPATVTYAPTLGIALSDFTRMPSGVYVRDLAVGSGAPIESTSSIRMTYRGFFADGMAFDTGFATRTTDPTPVADFVPGFRAGLLGVRQGSRRQLIIPPRQGYGLSTYRNPRAPNSTPIPAGSVLFFDVNVVSVTTPVDTTRPTTTARAPR